MVWGNWLTGGSFALALYFHSVSRYTFAICMRYDMTHPKHLPVNLTNLLSYLLSALMRDDMCFLWMAFKIFP